MFSLRIFVFEKHLGVLFVGAVAALTHCKRTPLKKHNHLRDELELNDDLTVILARVGVLEYKVRHERPGAASLSHTAHIKEQTGERHRASL